MMCPLDYVIGSLCCQIMLRVSMRDEFKEMKAKDIKWILEKLQKENHLYDFKMLDIDGGVYFDIHPFSTATVCMFRVCPSYFEIVRTAPTPFIYYRFWYDSCKLENIKAVEFKKTKGNTFPVIEINTRPIKITGKE